MTGLFDRIARQRRAIWLLFVVAVALGAVAALRLPSAILPEVTFPRITVLAESGELPSDVVLRTVTKPLEEAVRRVPGVREVRSTTSRGSAEINIDCAWGRDMNLALQRVQARIESVRPDLPPGTSLDARLMNPAIFPVLAYSLTSDRQSQALLRDFAIHTLQPELSRLPGVAEVIVQGGRRLEARVTLDPAALAARGLDAATVADAIRNASALGSVGLFASNQQLYLGIADGRPPDLDALRALPIPVAGAPPVRLDRLGTVALADAPSFTIYRARDREAVLVNLLRQPSASTVVLQQAATQWFREHRSTIPPGVTVEPFYDQSDLVRASIGSVRDSLVVGATLAVLVIILFLGSVRLGLAGALVLPGSIALTMIGYAVSGQSLNMMTLGGIAAAIGLVLDDAIVVVEQLAARTTGPGAVSRSAAMAEILPTLVGSSLCSIAIFAPFVLLGGVTGAFFRVLALAVVLMLVASLVLCLTVIPLASARLAHPTESKRERFRLARRIVAYAASHRWIGIALVATLVLAAIPFYLGLGTGFLPSMDEGSLIMDFRTPPGTSLAVTDRMLQVVEREIDATPEIRSWSRRTGDQLGFFITEPNHGDYVFRLRAHRRRSAEQVADDLRSRIEAKAPAIQVEFGQLVEDVIGDLTTNPQPIEVRVFCEDRSVAQEKAAEVATLLRSIPGVVDVASGVVVSGPTVTVSPTGQAARLGFTASDLARAVAPAVQGIDVGEIARGIRAWAIRVVMPPPAGRSGADALRAMPLRAGSAGLTPLGAVATIRTDPGETEIARDDLRTMVPVTARLSGRDLGSAMAAVRRRIRARIVLPPGASIRYAGLWAQQQSSFQGLAAVLLGAAALVVLILLATFRSWTRTLAVMAVVLASLGGVFAALFATGSTLNISSFVGAIMMVGIVAENAYFLVAAFQARLAEGATPSGAAHDAALRRARPVLMTTIAGVAALAPLALGVGAGSALLQPLAIAIVGGFVTSAFLLLLALPSLLAWTGASLD